MGFSVDGANVFLEKFDVTSHKFLVRRLELYGGRCVDVGEGMHEPVSFNLFSPEIFKNAFA